MSAPLGGATAAVPADVDRALGTTEALFHALGSASVCLPGLVALVEGPLDAELVAAAAAHVQRRHPLLRACIVDGHAGPRFVAAGARAPLLRVLAPGEDAAPAALLARELHVPHAPGAPPWRCTFAAARGERPLHALALGASHAVADGQSFYRILLDLVEAAGALRDGRPLPPLLPAGPALEAGLPPTPLAALLLHKARRLRSRASSPLVAMPPHARAGPGERRSRVLLRATAPRVLPRLAARCRDEGTSIEGALTAALVGALRPLVGGALRGISIAHQGSLRDACRPPISPEQVGCFVAGTFTRHGLEAGARFWETARDATRQLRAWRSSGLGLAAARAGSSRIGLVGARVAASAADPASLGRVSIAGISNCGRLEPARPPFAIREVYVGAGHHVVGDLLQLMVTGVDGRLMCTLVSVEPLVSAETAEGLADGVLDRLESAVGAQGAPRGAAPAAAARA